MLAQEDFNDDPKDAGEMGAGHAVTALYEVVPVGAEPVAPRDDSLTYQQVPCARWARGSRELLTLRVRYKEPQGTTSRLLETPVVDQDGAKAARTCASPGGGRVRACCCGTRTTGPARRFDHVLSLARGARGDDPQGYRGEFIGMVETARSLAAGAPAQ